MIARTLWLEHITRPQNITAIHTMATQHAAVIVRVSVDARALLSVFLHRRLSPNPPAY
jgi:hypothetical protein